MIEKLAITFGSLMKAQEMVLLLQGKKRVVRQGFYPHELVNVSKYCKENGIYMVKSPFKVLLADEGTGLFSNKGIRIAEKDKRPGMYFVYFSKNEEKVWLASYYETMQDHKGLGKVLGYPSCCVDFFCNSFNSRNVNLQHNPTNPWTNLSKRAKDAVLLSHFPCSSDCNESVNLAREYAHALSLVDKVYTRKLLEKLG